MGKGMLKGIPRVVVLFFTALVAACGGGGGGGGNTTPTSPGPVTLTSLAPAAVNAGAGATVLTATGSGFTTGSVIEWNGTALTTSYVSSTSLTATVPAADFMEPGTVPVTVSNASSGGASSEVVDFTVGEQSAPTVATVAPATVTAGGQNFVLVVNGTNFLPTASVLWNGSALPTVFQSSTVLTANVTAAQIVAAGSVTISVLNDSASGGASNTITFAIAPAPPVAPLPTLVSVSPTSIAQNQGNVTLTLTGTNFTATTQVVPFGVASLGTTYVSPTQLSVSFTVTGTTLAAGSTLNIVVMDPASGNRPSNALALQVTAAVPVVTGITPSSVYVSQGAFALTVTGEFLTATSVVYVNGSARPTALSNGQLIAQLTAADVAAVGTATITVKDSASGNVASNSIALSIYAQPTTGVSSMWPSTVPAGNGDFTLTVTGFGFKSDSVITWNGIYLTTHYVSDTRLTGLVPGAQVASVGTAAVNVLNPYIPGAGNNPLTLNIVAPSIDAVSYQINGGHTGAINFNNVSLPASAAWTVNIDGTPSYALIAASRVFVMSYGNGHLAQLSALDAATGAILWGPLPYSATFAGIAYDDGTLFVDSYAGGSAVLYAVDPSTGNQKWSAAIPQQVNSLAPPVAAAGIVYALNSQELTAYDETNGAILWQKLTAEAQGIQAVTVDGVFVTAPCNAQAFEPDDGTSLWFDYTGCEGGGGASPPVALSGRVYMETSVAGYAGTVYNAESGAHLGTFTYSAVPAVTSTTSYGLLNSTLQSVSLSGNTVNWSFSGDGGLITAPIAVNNYVFIGSSSGNLYGLDATTGNVVWTQNTGAAFPVPDFTGGLSAGDGLLVVPAGNSIVAYILSRNP